MTVKSIVLDGDYKKTIGSNKQQFLKECSLLLSSNGTRAVACVDVRPGSIIVDVEGKKHAVTAAVNKIKIEGLSLPSFPKLVAEGVVTIFFPSALGRFCLFFVCIRLLAESAIDANILPRGMLLVLSFLR